MRDFSRKIDPLDAWLPMPLTRTAYCVAGVREPEPLSGLAIGVGPERGTKHGCRISRAFSFPGRSAASLRKHRGGNGDEARDLAE